MPCGQGGSRGTGFVRGEGGGAQIEKRRLLIPQKIHLYPGESIRSSSFRAVVSVVVALSLKIATASMSPEISLVNDYEDVTTR